MDNSNKIILDLCGGTGAWSRPYRAAGYDVRLITLPDNDVCTYVPPADVYGILAAPPCTEFSLAKGSLPRDFESGVAVMAACLQIIWQCRIHGKPAFWALENPVGFMRQFLGRPHFTFEHWQYGDSDIKPTDIWGYFKEPIPTVKERPGGLVVKYPNGHTKSRNQSAPKCPPEYKGMGFDRAALRAITSRGFADAFYKANR